MKEKPTKYGRGNTHSRKSEGKKSAMIDCIRYTTRIGIKLWISIGLFIFFSNILSEEFALSNCGTLPYLNYLFYPGGWYEEKCAYDKVFDCERFEPRSHFKSRLSLILRVNIVLNRIVVVDSDWRFDNLCGSHPQSQSELYHVSWWYYTLVSDN